MTLKLVNHHDDDHDHHHDGMMVATTTTTSLLAPIISLLFKPPSLLFKRCRQASLSLLLTRARGASALRRFGASVSRREAPG
jgi:hypothetical protein